MVFLVSKDLMNFPPNSKQISAKDSRKFKEQVLLTKAKQSRASKILDGKKFVTGFEISSTAHDA